MGLSSLKGKLRLKGMNNTPSPLAAAIARIARRRKRRIVTRP